MKLNKSYKKIGAVVLSMNDVKSFENKIDEIIFFGKIYGFIVSYGVHTENVDFGKMTEKEFDRVIDFNLKGVYFCKAAASYFFQNKIKGKILLISSSRGNEPAWFPYGISKWGLNGMTEGLEKILAPNGITINTIRTGNYSNAAFEL